MSIVNDSSENASSNSAPKSTDVSNGHSTTNEPPAETEKTLGESDEPYWNMTVNLPGRTQKIQVMVNLQDQVQDVRQSIIELPETFQYTCFHLEHQGERVNDFAQLSDVEGLTTKSQLNLVEDPYTEKEARLHVVRVRELIGAAGDRTDVLQGILAGYSLYESVNPSENDSTDASASNAKPMADFQFSSGASVTALLPGEQKSALKCVKVLSISPWNPPPYHLRQRGHLMYLQITTNEGDQYQITSHVSGFYVNKSSSTKFDPMEKAAPKSYRSHSLLLLLSEISPSFEASFKKFYTSTSQREALMSYQITHAAPATPWIVPPTSSPLCLHQSDLTRTQESFLLSGVENIETLRDWNEEFQSTRELPKEEAQDRVFRERLTSKLFADYNDAAAKGAVLVARGEIAPLNPTEGRDAQIFVYNNIFFSFGADGVGTFASEGGDDAARVATGKDVLGVRVVNQLDIDGLFTPGTVVVDYLGKRIVGQSIVPGIFRQREPGENQIDYGAVDGKEVVASDDRFSSIFEKLSKALKIKKHAVWDRAGTRHDLEGSVETKGLLGTDGRKYALDLYRITPLDILWMEENGTAINTLNHSHDDKQAVYPHRMTVLRPELIDLFWKSRLRDWVTSEVDTRRQSVMPVENTKVGDITDAPSAEGLSKQDPSHDDFLIEKTSDVGSTEVPDKQESARKPQIDVADFHFALNPDAFSGQTPQTDDERNELLKDEQDVRAAAEYLRAIAIPELVRDLKEGEIGCPMDGTSLSRLLHRKGINLRYLGKIASLAEDSRLRALKALTIQEMVSRAFKHVAGRYLRPLPVPFTGACIAHLLNCLLGTRYNSSPVAEIDATLAALYPGVELAFQNASPDSLRIQIEKEVSLRYTFQLEKTWIDSLKHLQMLREVALKLGLQLVAKDYQFLTEIPSSTGNEVSSTATNGHSTNGKKKKKNGDGSNTATSTKMNHPLTTFVADDILNLVPVVKEAAPKSALAEEALEAGRISILQGEKKLGQELLLESLSLHEQIYGILHPEVARFFNTLSMQYYQLDEKEAAVELARKAVIVSERTLGVDSSETLLSYLNLGLFTHAYGKTAIALTYIRHALELWKIIYGSNHPDSITTINNAAVMLQHLKCYHESRVWFEISLAICEDIYGKNSINAATLLFQLAQALALDSDSKASVSRIRESYNIFLAELGPNDRNTKEAENWLEQLTSNAVSVAKHAKDAQARRLRNGLRLAPKATLGQTPAQPQVDRTVQLASGKENVNVMGLNSTNLDELLKYIEGGEKKKPNKKVPGRTNPKRRGGASVPSTV